MTSSAPASRRQAQKTTSTSTATECKICDNFVTDSGVECDACQKWYHYTCGGLDKREYELLSLISKKAEQSVHWFCPDCNFRTLLLVNTINDLKAKMDNTVSEISDIKKEITGFNDKTNKLTEGLEKTWHEIQLMQNQIKENIQDFATIKKSVNDMEKNMADMEHGFLKQVEEVTDIESQNSKWADAVKKHINNEMGVVNNEIVEVQNMLTETKNTAIEERDKENRRNNLVIYRAPESSAAVAVERTSDDLQQVLHFFNQALSVGASNEDIVKVVRLGKRDTSSAPKPRPLLIQLSNHSIRNLIMESLYKIKLLTDSTKVL